MRKPIVCYAAPVESNAAAPVEEQPAQGLETPVEEGTFAAPAETPVPEEEAAPETPPPAADASPEEQEDWRDKQIRKQHRILKDRERENETLKRQVSDLAALAQRPVAEGEVARAAAPSSVPMTDDEINRRAEVLASQNRFKEKLTDLNARGEKTFGPEWSKSLDRLTQFGELTDLPWIMNGVDNPDKVLVELGKNPGEYQRIMDLPSERRQAEYVRISDRQQSRPAPSRAAAPTEAVTARSVPQVGLRDDMTDEQWHEQRRADKAKRFVARGGR